MYGLFAEESRRLRTEALAQELARQRAGAPSILMVNRNSSEATGVKEPGSLLANNIYGDVNSLNNEINNEKLH